MLLDWEIYRHLLAPSENQSWGTFPHLPTSQIASRLGVSVDSIWRRLREWRRTGFLRGYLVLPHPQVFGVGLVAHTLSVTHPSDKKRLLNDLDLVDGVIFANTDVGPRVGVISIADKENSQQRRRELIRRMPGVASMGPTRKIWLPPMTGSLSMQDLRIVMVLRDSPECSTAELAHRTGVSTKTVYRRLTRMRESHVVLSHLLEDWTRFPGLIVGFRLKLAPETDWTVVGRRFESKVPGALLAPYVGGAPKARREFVTYETPVSAGPDIESVVETALGIPGVSTVETFFPMGERGYAGWIDDRIGLMNRSMRMSVTGKA